MRSNAMKINTVLARHPRPWVIRRHYPSVLMNSRGYWQVHDANGVCVFDDGSCGGEVVYACNEETRDAILELVEAHVIAKETKQ